jgi:U3 small nucleolar RNA-associated protein 21
MLATVDEALFHYAKTLSPPAVDLEIRTLASLEHLRLFLHALTRRLRSKRDFEAVQTFTSVFMRAHGDVLVSNEELRPALEALRVTQREESARVLELITSSLGTLSFIRDV